MDGLYLANQIDEAGNTITLITFDRGASWHRLRPPRESNCTQGDEVGYTSFFHITVKT